MNFLKDESRLLLAELAPARGVELTSRATGIQIAIRDIYNRLGGLFQEISEDTGISAPALAAVWYVESGGLRFTPNRAALRFEVHRLFPAWGKRNRIEFETHFRFGGFNGQPGNPWQNHEFRTETTGPFASVHHNQTSEYAALTLAQVRAGDETALRCASIGGCQIMLTSHALVGYATARQMYEAFQASERAHVLAFHDFCAHKPAPKTGSLLSYLQAMDWTRFATFYNGPGQVGTYSAKLSEAYEQAHSLLAPSKAA